MKITERHVKIFSAILFAIAIALFVYQSFIDTSGHPTNTQKRLLGTEEPSSLVGAELGKKPFNSSPEQTFDTERVNKPFKGDLEQMKQRKSIRALVVYSKTDFFFIQGGMKGIQVELLQEYENFLNRGVKSAEKRVRIIYIPVTFNNLLPALKSGKGDIAADFLTITPERKKQFSFASGRKMPVSELVVSHNLPPI
jgi:ABC-type amino acid transport substrate-binding protein